MKKEQKKKAADFSRIAFFNHKKHCMVETDVHIRKKNKEKKKEKEEITR